MTEINANSNKVNESFHQKLDSFEKFNLKRVINDNSSSKTIFLEGTFDSSEEQAVVILEKTAFDKESIEELLNGDTALVSNFNNNIYSSFSCTPNLRFNNLKATLIYPCTKKHIEKYEFQPCFVVKETSEIYQNVVFPHLLSQQFSLQWVDNILSHKSESERIIFEDTDPELGFVLLPDLKWNEKDMSSLYVIAICHQKGLKSLRDLSNQHLPLLKNIYLKATEAIFQKYNVPKCKLRVYFHYQPSYYHLHVHFSSLEYDAPGIQPERAHLFDNVVNNIELVPDYYQRATLVYSVKQNDPLYGILGEAGVFE